MTKTATQAVVVVQYDKLLQYAVNEEAATNDETLLAQQIQQVLVYICCYSTLPEVMSRDNFVGAQAYGPAGLGILTVSGVPGFAELRQRLLPLAHAFAVSRNGASVQCRLAHMSLQAPSARTDC